MVDYYLQTVDLQLVLFGGHSRADPEQLACSTETDHRVRDGVLQRSDRKGFCRGKTTMK